jgi:uncharacterized protein
VNPILFTNVPDAGLAVNLSDRSWLPESFQGGSGSVAVAFVLRRQKEGVHLTGEMKLDVDLQCDRCLDSYNTKIDGTFSVDLVVGEPDPIGDDDVEYICNAADMDTMFVESAQVDLGEIARQQLYLQIPVKKICTADCPGLCQCGEKNGSPACNCEKTIDSPFAALAALETVKKD